MSSNDLPREIFRDMLERLPTKSLIIFSSVSKSWYSLITDPGFITSHLNKVKLHSEGYLMHMSFDQSGQPLCSVICNRTLAKHFNVAFPFDCESFNATVAGSCNGLLCVTDGGRVYFGRSLYLWNPYIRKFKALPRPPMVLPQFFDMRTWVVLGLGFDHVNGDQKIVRLSYFWDNNDKCVPDEIEVYTLKTNSWRRIGATVLCKPRNSSKAFVNGAIHWIAHRPKGPDYNLILSFEFSSEVFEELMLPTSCYDGIGIHSEVLEEFHGSLSLLIHGSPDDRGMVHCCYMWVMKEYGDAESWVKQFKFVVDEGIYWLPGLTTDGKIIYQNYKMEYFLCDPVDGRHKNIGVHGINSRVVAFMESLVLLGEH